MAAAHGAEEPRSTAGPIVVELFTSQGCSSCPPADQLLGELASRPNVIALGFHVDYWDDIGWRDRFSMTEATQRQRRYVGTLGLPSAFTPQLVINGRESFVGSDRRRIVAALSPPALSVPIEVKVDGGELVVSLPDAEAHRGYELNLAAYLPRATTAIGRGENSGRTLTEFDVVLQFQRLGEWHGKSRTLRVSLNTLPDEASRVAILLQAGDGGPIAGAASAIIR
jgi:hypothetical protein